MTKKSKIKMKVKNQRFLLSLFIFFFDLLSFAIFA